MKRAAAAQLAELNARLTELGNAKTDLEQQKDGYFGRTVREKNVQYKFSLGVCRRHI